MMTVRHNERKSACNVAANEQNGRSALPLRIRFRSRPCATRDSEKRETRGARQAFRGMFDELSAAKSPNERINFRIRTQKRKEFFCGVEIPASPFSAQLDAGQFLRLRVQRDGGSEHGFGRRLLRSPRGCAKSDRIS
jgi:hypothetical protein